MHWYLALAYFFGGAFIANASPHLAAGISGRQLQSPFASPPFKGLSSPAVNVAWGLFNLGAAYLLLVQVGAFDVRNGLQVASCFAGFGAMAFQCARSFSRLRGDCDPGPRA